MKGRELAEAIGKGLIGSIPVVGSVAAEIADAVIPDPRLDRLESHLTLLEGKVSTLGKQFELGDAVECQVPSTDAKAFPAVASCTSSVDLTRRPDPSLVQDPSARYIELCVGVPRTMLVRYPLDAS